MRIASYRIHQSLVEKPVRIEEFWPMWNDKKTRASTDRIVMDAEMLATIKKVHNLK